MASIATPLLQRKKEPEEEQLLKLFWNRAELKKELAALRRDKERLVEQLHQQENLALRAQQRLEKLENLLADPLHAINALVYYQLRGIWQQCRRRLLRLARELQERQKEREARHARSHFEQSRDAEMAQLDNTIGALVQRIQIVESDLGSLQADMRRLRGFWHYFNRRRAAERIDAARATLDGLKSQRDGFQAQRRLKEHEPPPPLPELSTEGKRNINLAIIAMAQQLLVQLAEHNVAGLAREAAMRGVTDVHYGDVAECQSLSQMIESVVRGLEQADKLNVLVRRRAEFLKSAAQFRRDIDTVPVASCFSGVVLAITDTGQPRPVDDRLIPVNILADEYWDIYSVLLN